MFRSDDSQKKRISDSSFFISGTRKSAVAPGYPRRIELLGQPDKRSISKRFHYVALDPLLQNDQIRKKEMATGKDIELNWPSISFVLLLRLSLFFFSFPAAEFNFILTGWCWTVIHGDGYTAREILPGDWANGASGAYIGAGQWLSRLHRLARTFLAAYDDRNGNIFYSWHRGQK